MCLSRLGVRSISGFSRALMTNGAIAFTSCTSSSSTDGTSASSRRHEFRPAQVHLLQVLIELAGGKQILLREQLFGQQRHLRERGRVREARPVPGGRRGASTAPDVVPASGSM